MLGGSSERILFVLGKGSTSGSRRIRSGVFYETCTIFEPSVHGLESSTSISRNPFRAGSGGLGNCLTGCTFANTASLRR